MRLGNGVLAEKEDRGRQHGAGMAPGYPFNQMVKRTDPAAGDDRNRDCIGNRAGKLKIIPGLGAIPVHRGNQQLARTQFGQADGVGNGIDPGCLAAAVGEDFPAARPPDRSC